MKIHEKPKYIFKALRELVPETTFRVTADGTIIHEAGEPLPEKDKMLEKIEEVKLKTGNSKKKKEYEAYLKSTDWYIIRKMETGKEIPVEVVEKRKQAREILSTISG